MSVLAAAASGAILGASLIIAIGAQNAFVLRHGIAHDHIAAVVVTCVLCDWVLIVLGAAGFGRLVRVLPAVTAVATWGGAAFLVAYGTRSFLTAVHPGSLESDRAPRAPALSDAGAAVMATLAVSLLNPHVYLDTVVLLGSVASRYPVDLRWAFVAGAAAASLAWFCALGYGARILAPAFARPLTWRLLDVAIGIIMWGIAVQLAASQLGAG